MKGMGLNTIRLEGHLMPEDFFEQMDQAGILVNAGYQCCDAWELQSSGLTTSADYSICDGFAELNKLDGFDLQPRVAVPFTGTIQLKSVTAKDFYISTARGAFVSGLRQLTFDPATHTLAGITDAFLREDTTYKIHVTNGIRDSRGRQVNACARVCVVRFTTRTASGELVRIRRSMDLPLADPQNAYAQAGFPGASSSTAETTTTARAPGCPAGRRSRPDAAQASGRNSDRDRVSWLRTVALPGNSRLALADCAGDGTRCHSRLRGNRGIARTTGPDAADCRDRTTVRRSPLPRPAPIVARAHRGHERAAKRGSGWMT